MCSKAFVSMFSDLHMTYQKWLDVILYNYNLNIFICAISLNKLFHSIDVCFVVLFSEHWMVAPNIQIFWFGCTQSHGKRHIWMKNWWTFLQATWNSPLSKKCFSFLWSPLSKREIKLHCCYIPTLNKLMNMWNAAKIAKKWKKFSNL